MAIPVSAIIRAIGSALPGLIALFKAFSKKDEPSSEDITDKARNEIEELESWKESALKESEGL